MASEKALALKQQGNALFQREQYADAAQKFQAAIKAEPSKSSPTTAPFWSNLAFCYLKMRDYLAYQDAARNCINADPSFVKGYYRLCDAHQAVFEFNEAKSVVEKGLQLDPDNQDLKNKYQSILGDISKRKDFKEILLKAPTSSFEYFGGQGRGFSDANFPDEGSYAQSSRPALPPLSNQKYKKLHHLDPKVKPLFQSFFQGDMLVKWVHFEDPQGAKDPNASPAGVIIEAYVPGETAPILIYTAGRKVMKLGAQLHSALGAGIKMDQNQTYYAMLTTEQKKHLEFIVLERFLRQAGAVLIEPTNGAHNVLHDLIDKVAKDCDAAGLYTDAAEMKLVGADIAINHNFSDFAPSIVHYCETLESAERYAAAGDIYAELGDGQNFPPFTYPNAVKTYGYAGLAYKRAMDYVKAEVYYVASLRSAGPHWHWRDPEVDNNLQNMMIYYEIAHRAVTSGLRKDQAHRKMDQSCMLLVGLLSIAGLRCQGNTMFREASTYQTILKDEYKKSPKKCYKAVVHATMARTMDDYHTRLFACGGLWMSVDMDQANQKAEQQQLLRDQQEKSRGARNVTRAGGGPPGKEHQYFASRTCSGCQAMVQQMAGNCPCRTVQYCSRDCQKAHWKVHKRVCPKHKSK